MAIQPTLPPSPAPLPARDAPPPDWREALAGLPERTDLPGLRRAEGPGAARTVTVRTPLDARVAEGLSALAEAAGTTPGTALLAGAAGLLTLLRCGTDLPLGSAGTGTRAGVRVLRVATSTADTFHSLLAATAAQERAAAGQDGVPHEELAAAVNADRATPGLPLFQVGVAPDGTPPPGHGGALWFSLGTAPGGAGPARLRLTHSPAVLGHHDAQRLCDRLARVLARLVREPGARLDTVDCLLPGEASGLIGEGFAGAVPEGGVERWFEERVRLSGGEVAVVDGPRRLTYAEVDARANRLARALLAAGAGAERAVAVVLPRSAESVIAFLAVLKSGATYMPVDTELPPARVTMMLEDARPAVVVTDAAGARLAENAKAPPLIVDQELSACAGHAAHGLSAADLSAPVTGATPAYLLYTSGSTGRPKGVVMTREALANLMAWHLDELPGGPGRVTVQFTSVSFDISVQEMLAALLSGAALAIVPEDVRRSPQDLAPWLQEHGVTDLFAPNVVIELVCRAALEQGLTLPALAQVAQAGEALVLSDAVREFFRLRPGRRLHNHYGPTETHAVTSWAAPADVASWPAAAPPVGLPVWNTSLYVLDEALRLVPTGVAGELYVSGVCLARGYAGRPDLTADRFLPCPWGPPGSRMYRTGDLVRRRPDGAVVYLGRTDHQVKIRGVRVELGEIEAAVRQAPGVRDTVLVTAGDAAARRIDAYLVPAPDADPAALGTAVRAELRRTLPPAMVPASFTVVPVLPLNSNGKVDRAALPEPVFAGPGEQDRPRTGEEERLARIFAEVLGLPAVGVHDNLYDIGGHSLLAADLTVRVRKEFQAELSLGEVLSNPSVAELAALLTRVEPARPPVTPRTAPGDAPASFAQQSLWVLDQLEGAGPQYNEPYALRLTGRPDPAALREALADVAGRHQVLRTVLDAVDGQVRQRVLDGEAARPRLDEVAVEPRALDAAVREAARVPFDLAADLPVRATLFRLAPEDHLLLVVLHHIACDGASLRPFLRDLATAYGARTGGRAPEWAELPVQYADFAAWQRDLFEGGGPASAAGLLAGQRRYWEKHLAGLPAAIPLPLDRERPPVRTGAGGAVPITVDIPLHRAVRAYAQRSRTTTFTVVHAALAALLAERGAGEDIVVAAAVSDRGDPALDELVGFFVRTLVLRVDASGGPDFAELLDRVREADLGAFAHQDLPFEHLVELVNPVRSFSHHPLAQTMLAFQVEESEPPRLAGLSGRFEEVELGVAKFDLCFKVVERFGPGGEPAGMAGTLEYATDIFDPGTARSLAEGLVGFLRAGADGTA
ncbi:amino acid adenylation domain-containing protein [Streptomyces sp. SID8374]|uniref:non-ribosomal peptide synthetase n=1 Tax=Streptomyces sp. SID8374 TaxID=2690354 RepID=UPI0013719945|nr:non-ribosomal peptide synthetase [Streptomyces sp. SID8374]MYX14337.1 amino acid adenylation domain-containing protein [Streptomyces sp. SID8374]